MKRSHLAWLTIVAVLIGIGNLEAKIIIGPLTAHHPPVGFTYPPSDKTVTVTDERPDKSFIAAGLLGGGAEKGKGVYLAYVTPKVGDLAAFMTSAAGEAVTTLGMKAGDGARLAIVVKDFRIDMYRLSGFSPMNCMGYAMLTATLTGRDGTEINKSDVKLALYDYALPKTSMKQVTEKAVSSMYTLAAWQATVRTLIDGFALAPGPALEGLRLKAVAEKDEDRSREMIFWLGLTGGGSDGVKASLLELFNKSDEQKTREASAEALGMLGASELSGDIQSLLAGTKKLANWDIEDNQEVWYLIDTLALLGKTDLQSNLPKGKLKMGTKVQDLIRFHERAEFGTPSAAEQKMVDKARAEVSKKRT